jgi:hypothetical protein
MLLSLVTWLAAVRCSNPRAQSEGAASLRAALSVTPGASCLDESLLEARVIEWLGGTRAGRRPAHPGARWRARCPFGTVRDLARGHGAGAATPGARPADCTQLHAALGLAIAIAVRATLVEELRLRELAPPRPPVRVTRTRRCRCSKPTRPCAPCMPMAREPSPIRDTDARALLEAGRRREPIAYDVERALLRHRELVAVGAMPGTGPRSLSRVVVGIASAPAQSTPRPSSRCPA